MTGETALNFAFFLLLGSGRVVDLRPSASLTSPRRDVRPVVSCLLPATDSVRTGGDPAPHKPNSWPAGRGPHPYKLIIKYLCCPASQLHSKLPGFLNFFSPSCTFIRLHHQPRHGLLRVLLVPSFDVHPGFLSVLSRLELAREESRDTQDTFRTSASRPIPGKKEA